MTYKWIGLFLELALRAPTQSTFPCGIHYQKMQRASVQYERRSGLLVAQDRPRQREDGFFDRIHIRVCPCCFLSVKE